jgi:hypothetical protein
MTALIKTSEWREASEAEDATVDIDDDIGGLCMRECTADLNDIESGRGDAEDTESVRAKRWRSETQVWIRRLLVSSSRTESYRRSS